MSSTVSTLTAYCPLPTAHCLLPTAYCLLPTAYCLLSSSAFSKPGCPGTGQAGVQTVELLQPRVDGVGLLHAGAHRLERLVAVAGHADHNRLVPWDAAEVDQFLRHRHRGATRGLGEDAFRARQQA